VQRSPTAFTLIELLIVVAIIAILAAIAVPNFLEAQTRSKVARVMADHKSIATAQESYRVDNTQYIVGWARLGEVNPSWQYDFLRDKFVRWRLAGLTTPVAYITSLPGTPFLPEGYRHSGGVIPLTFNVGSEYDTSRSEISGSWYNNTGALLAGAHKDTTLWHLRDPGPDGEYTNSVPGAGTNLMPYDPTNGTVSIGDIWRFGP
jgi:prepilin-type N-terminal cleavage/methylation domain-containing protein